MPESRWKPFFPQAMDSLQFEIIPEETSFEILPEESSLEFAPEDEDDCFVLETLPEICIPAPLLTPLPLQCLAASALPDGVRREIESVTASVADLRSRSASSEYSEAGKEDLCSLMSGSGLAGDSALKRLVVTRDAAQPELVNDLGIGVRISGGMMCKSCGILHAVITAVNRNSTHSSEICEGMCVVEWCGQSLLGATFEQTRRILGSTQGETVEMVVKECGGRQQSKDSNRACNIFLDFTALSANVRMLATDSSSKDEEHENGILLAPPQDYAVPVSDSKIARSVSSYVVREMNPPSATKQSARPASAHLPVTYEAVEDEEDSPSHELAFSLPSVGVPKTPTVLPDDMFADFFSSLPSGMIKLSLSYDEGQERLRIILSQVKARSSREVDDSSIVFINTCLIPDLRSQGTKFTKVAITPSDIQNAPIYSIRKDEIESTSLRVLLWDTPKKGSATFRGEVLLSLSDDEIVNLDGDPAWYTVCPEDPNLPHLPAPITHRGKQRERVEQLFNRVKQTLNHGPTQALSYLKHYASKTSVSGGDDDSLVSTSSMDLTSSKSGSTSSLPSMRRRRSEPGKKRQRQRHRDRFGSAPGKHLLWLGKSQEETHHSKPAPVENSATSIHKESQRLSKLINILHVLQEEDSSLVSSIDSDPAEEEKRTRLQTIVSVLKEEPEMSETSPVESPDDGYLQLPSEDSDFSTLDRRNRKRSPKAPATAGKTRSPEPDVTEKSQHSFAIPELAIATSEEVEGAHSTENSSPNPQSLSLQDSATGKELRSSLTIPGSLALGGAATSKELQKAQSARRGLAIDPRRESFFVIPGLRGSLNAGKTVHQVSVYSFLSESDSARDSLNSQEEVRLSAHSSSGQHQQHYQLVDEYQTDDEVDGKTGDAKEGSSDSSLIHTAKKNHTVVARTDSDCSCYSVNINVGKQEEIVPTANRLSQASLNRPTLHLTDRSDRLSKKRKSRSVGDILDLDSDDEVPFEESADPPGAIMEGCPTLAEGNECDGRPADAGLETRAQSSSLKVPPTQPPVAPSSGKGRAASLFSRIPWGKKKGARKQTLRKKWGSLDNLIETIPSRSKKERRRSQQGPTAPSSSSRSSSLQSENGKIPSSGSMRLELRYDLQNPLLTMTLEDVVFLPAKGLSSDVTVKAQLFHNSTRVCMLKRKTNISLKKTTAPPLASFQFEIDITNLALQVSLVSGSKLFSKKSSAQVWIDLDALQLQQDQHCSQWFQFSKTV